ncbi:MAG TPA: tape measure protein [Pirellulales bacterium]|nr:tape measure protein [Pirellulales bacterium]
MAGAPGGFKLAEMFVEFGTHGLDALTNDVGSIRAMFRDLPAALGRDFAHAMAGVKRALSGTGTLLAGFGQSAHGFVSTLGGGATALVGLARSAADARTLITGLRAAIASASSANVAKMFSGLSAGMAGAKASVQAFYSVLSGARSPVAGLAAALAAGRSSLAGFVTAARGAAGVFRDTLRAVVTFGGGTRSIVTTLSGLRSALSGAGTTAMGLGRALSGAWSAARGGISALGSVVAAAGRVTLALTKASAASFGAAFQRVFNMAKAAAAGFASAASASLRGFQSAVGRAVSAVKSAASSMGGAFQSVMSHIHPLRLALVGLAAVTAGGFGMVKAAAGMERMEVAFGTLTGSAENAKKVLSDLSDFAAATPFEMPELADASRKLLAFGIQQDKLIETLRRVGDVASGVDAPIGEIAEIYGKARVQGRLFAEDINQLTGRGIPVIGELAKQFGVAESEVRKLVENGQVSFANLEEAFRSLTAQGGKFAGMMEAQSHTASGMWSTLMDNIKMVARDLGAEMLPAVKAVMGAFIDLTGGAGGSLGSLKEKIASVSQAIASYVPTVVGWLKDGITYTTAYAEVLGSAFGAALRIMGQLGSAVSALLPSVSGVGASFLDSTMQAKWFFDNLEGFILLGVEQVKLFSANVGDQIGTTFMNAVRLAAWFSQNWVNVFMGAAKAVLQIMENVGQNIGAIWDAALNYMKTGEFKPDLTPITDGVKEAIGDLMNSVPQMAQAAVRSTTPEIDRLKNELAKAWDQMFLARSKAQVEAEQARRDQESGGGAELKPGGGEAESDEAQVFSAHAAGKKEDKFGIHGLEEFHRFLQQGISAKDNKRDKVAEQQGKDIADIANGKKTINVRVTNDSHHGGARFAA